MKTVVPWTEVLGLTKKTELVKPAVEVLKSILYIAISSDKRKRVRIIQVIVLSLFNKIKKNCFRTSSSEIFDSNWK